MRSPINQVPVNGISVNVWTEAPGLVAESGAFGVAERHAYVGGTPQSEALIAPTVAKRTAYPDQLIGEGNASLSFVPLRTAWQFGKAEGWLSETVSVTRYAWVGTTPAMLTTASHPIDDSVVFVYAVAKAKPVRGSAISWVAEAQIKKIKVRLRKPRGDRQGLAIVRCLPNTVIGQGVATSRGSVGINPGGIYKVQKVQSAVAVEAFSALSQRRAYKGFGGVSVGEGIHRYDPTVYDASLGVKYSSFFARGISEATSQSTNIRYVHLKERLKSASTSTVFTYRQQKGFGNSKGYAQQGRAQYWLYRVHRFKEVIQASLFSFYSTETYRLIWLNKKSIGEGTQASHAINLRWVGVTGSVTAASEGAAWFRRYGYLRGITASTGEGVSENKVYRSGESSVLAGLESGAVGERHVYLNGKTNVEALYGPSSPSFAVRWVQHGASDLTGAKAESAAVQLKTQFAWGPAITGDARTGASTTRVRLVFGSNLSAGEVFNLIEPLRTAWQLGTPRGLGDTDLVDQKLSINPWYFLEGEAVSIGFSEAKGLRIFFVEPAPDIYGISSASKFVIKINAGADAPDRRVVFVGETDRSMSVPYSNREYKVA